MEVFMKSTALEATIRDFTTAEWKPPVRFAKPGWKMKWKTKQKQSINQKANWPLYETIAVNDCVSRLVLLLKCMLFLAQYNVNLL